MQISQIKNALCQSAEKHKNIFLHIAQELHTHPELSGAEYKSSAFLKDILATQGFTILLDSPKEFSTSFHASKGEGPVQIGFLAEYDALPDLGHACGHNLIAAISTLAAIVTSEVLADKATIHLFGCPAEETLGSKITMAEQGLFDKLDAALICHPSNATTLGGTSYASHPLRITFLGQSAHVADTEYHGINALDALVDFYTQLLEKEKTFRQPYILGKIITEGGTAPNIVPDRATLKATIRSLNVHYLEEVMLPEIKALAQNISQAHGTDLELEHFEPLFMNMLNDKALQSYMQANLELVGIHIDAVYADDYADGSTDVGNVSHRAPTIEPEVKIGDSIYVHTQEFAQAAGSKAGTEQAFLAAKALAMTAADVINNKI